MKRTLAALFLLFLLFFSSGCSRSSYNTCAEKDGRCYGVTRGAFLGRWWNYFERGTSFADGGFWQKAEADFRQALGQWDEDRRRVRTYGRHLIDYFPHRELGIVLFRQGRYPEAVQELEASLATATSARAHFYLDKARQARIEQEGLDRTPPAIRITSPASSEIISNAQTLTVEGVASDDTFVKEIRIHWQGDAALDDPIFVRIDLSEPRIGFAEEIPLRAGENEIRITVRDLAGKSSIKTIRISGDRTGPVLSASPPVRRPDGRYLLNGYAHDPSGVRTLTINGRSIGKTGAEEIAIRDILLPSHGGRAVIEAEDMAGNRTRTLVDGASLSQMEGFEAAPLLLAASDGAVIPARTRGVLTPEKRIQGYRESAENHAVIIGINDYAKWPELKTAVNDARALQKILTTRYGYEEEQIVLLTDGEATWEKILHVLSGAAARLSENDNLLVYFAGHGQLDPLTDNGYWIPRDGSRNDPSTWITNTAIRDILTNPKVKGKNILVIADSCYSGSLLRQGPGAGVAEAEPPGPPSGFFSFLRGGGSVARFGRETTDLEKRILELARQRSRQVISSGGIEPVSDRIPGAQAQENPEHSLFATYLLKALTENRLRVVDIEYLYNTRIWKSIVDQGGQRPRIGRLKTLMDADGQFVFVQDTAIAAGKAPPKKDADAVAGNTAYRRPQLPDGFPLDAAPPEIRFNRGIDGRTVYIEQVLLEIDVDDESGVQSVSVNGRKILRRPGRYLHLNHLAALEKVGENRLVIECMDQMGNRSRQEIRLHRKVQKIHETGVRMSAVPFILGPESAAKPDAESSQIAAKAYLLRRLTQCGRFNIIDATYSPNSLKTPVNSTEEMGAAMENARALDADFLIYGMLLTKEETGREAGGASLQILIDVVETDTGERLTTQDVYDEDLSLANVRNLCRGIVVKLRDALPLIGGQVVRDDGNAVIINLGESSRIKKGMHLIFFEEGEPVIDPDTGRSLGSDTVILGEGRIERLLPEFSYTKPFARMEIPGFERGQRLVMK